MSLEPDAATEVPKAEEISTLIALYQTERADSVSMQAINATLVGLAVAYAGATAVVLNQELIEAVNPWIVALLPAPLWFIALFLGSFAASISHRGLSVLMLERKIVAIAGLNAAERGIVGLTGTEQITDFQRGSLLTKLTILLAFGGELLIVVGYTALMLVQAYLKESSNAALLVPGIVYVVMLLLLLANARENETRRRQQVMALVGRGWR